VGLTNPFVDQAVELERAAFPRAAATLFQPIARMLVRKGVGAKSTIDMIKRAFVSATIEILKERNFPITTPRIQLFSGLPAREIDKIREALEHPDTNEPSVIDQIGLVLMTWHTDRRYIVPFTGAPAELALEDDPHHETFSGLVGECAPALNWSLLLEELIRVGAVQFFPDTNRVRALSRVYIPEAYSPSSAERLGRMVRNFTETIDANFETASREERRFDRHVIADFGVSPESEEAFRATVRAEGQALLESLDKWLQQQKRVTDSTRRIGVVVFQFVEDDSQLPSKRYSGVPTSEPDSNAAGTDAGPIEPAKLREDQEVIDVLTYRGPKK
jgi:Family of unknown function (DUF6502)